MHILIPCSSNPNLFLTSLFSIRNFCVQYSRINLREHIRNPFPQCKKLPQLSKCFQEFQKFLFNSSTWIQCQCEHSVLKEAQNSFNMVAVLMNVEKKYGLDFWNHKRRVQASICHFFAQLVYFLASLFPNNDSRQTLQSLKAANKLCTSLKALQELVNKILEQINPMIQFLYQETFWEQKKLTIIMLQQIRQILLNLPNLNKRKFKHQFELIKYLYVIIPIQLSKNQYKFKQKRKKTFTISNDIELKYHSDETVSNSIKKQFNKENEITKNRLSLQKLSQKYVKEKFRAKIIKRFESKEKDAKQQSLSFNTLDENSMPQIFKFSQKLRKYSFYLAQKKFTKSTFQTRQTLELGIHLNKERKVSDFGKTSSTPSKDKQFGRTYSIQKQKNHNNETIRSKKSSFQKTHRKTIIEESQNFRHQKLKTLSKSKRKNEFLANEIIQKPMNEMPFECIPSKKINIYTGEVKGWGIIQEKLTKKIVAKKIRELIHMKEVD